MYNIKYNVYYSITKNGPWTLANTTPIDHSDNGNSYTITGLDNNTQYYISIIGGYVNASGTFTPLANQPIGSDAKTGFNIEISRARDSITNNSSAKTFTVTFSYESSLRQGFSIEGIVAIEDFQGDGKFSWTQNDWWREDLDPEPSVTNLVWNSLIVESFGSW